MSEENSREAELGLLSTETARVRCLTCHAQVEVKLLPFGGGHVATCPICNQLAYNGN